MRTVQDTHLRYLVMLQAMPVGRWLRIEAIQDRLRQRGFHVSDRTVQRDLWKLAAQFGLEEMEVSAQGRPQVWRRTRPLEAPRGAAVTEAA